jgi:integral membrane sensor domain MASE1
MSCTLDSNVCLKEGDINRASFGASQTCKIILENILLCLISSLPYLVLLLLSRYITTLSQEWIPSRLMLLKM